MAPPAAWEGLLYLEAISSLGHSSFPLDKDAAAGDLSYVQFAHQTPLFRQLRGEEMKLQRNKVVNLKLAAARLDGILLFPGETFSYWRIIGKPTRKKGYLDGMVLCLGQMGSDVGGGLCSSPILSSG